MQRFDFGYLEIDPFGGDQAMGMIHREDGEYVLYSEAAAKIASMQKDIDRLSRPWSVSIVTDDGHYDANVIDVGHADRILAVELPEALRSKNEIH